MVLDTHDFACVQSLHLHKVASIWAITTQNDYQIWLEILINSIWSCYGCSFTVSGGWRLWMGDSRLQLNPGKAEGSGGGVRGALGSACLCHLLLCLTLVAGLPICALSLSLFSHWFAASFTLSHSPSHFLLLLSLPLFSPCFPPNLLHLFSSVLSCLFPPPPIYRQFPFPSDHPRISQVIRSLPALSHCPDVSRSLTLPLALGVSLLWLLT